MRTYFHYLFAGLILLLTACQTDNPTPTETPFSFELNTDVQIAPLDGRKPLDRAAIDRLAYEALYDKGEFNWDDVDAYVAWSAVVASDGIVAVGYQPAGFQNINERIHEIDVNAAEWKAVRQALMQFIVDETNRLHPDKKVGVEDLVVLGEKELPYFAVRLTDYETLAKLREMDVVRYAEPMGYGYEEPQATRSGSGCGGGPPSGSISTNDFVNISPSNTKLSWQMRSNATEKIESAWGQGARGQGITVGLIDTGVGPNQSKLGSGFASGQSTGRYIQRYGTYQTGWWWWKSYDGPNDQCGHGTTMASLIAAPRAGSGAVVGSAYQANLISVRGTSDVVINGSNEKDGVAEALVLLGNRSDVRIISMSIGDIFSSGVVKDGVRFANNKGKILYAAAGTSTTFTNWVGVIFPASMNETVAVTGIKTGSGYSRCNICHSGSKVDFVVVMQDRNNSDRTTLTLHTSGNKPRYTSGSSAATATMAGMTAQLWSKYPTWSKTQILNRLKQATEFYPNRNSQYGYGKINLLNAVTGQNL
ncbi:MAG: S8/S53 family peptidase [Bacteroidota bacterium]